MGWYLPNVVESFSRRATDSDIYSTYISYIVPNRNVSRDGSRLSPVVGVLDLPLQPRAITSHSTDVHL